MTSKLFSEKYILKLERDSYKKIAEESKAQIAHYQSEIEKLKEMYLVLKRSQYGSKSEKWQSEEQLKFVINEAENLISKAPSVEGDENHAEEETEVKSHKRKTNGARKPLPEHLEREVVYVELPKEELTTAEGEELKIIGYEVSEKLDYTPSKLKVIEYHRAQYGYDSGDYAKTVEVKTVFPKCMATEGLVAAVIIAKFADGLPLYRQEEIFKREDVTLPRCTLARWVIKGAESLILIYNVLNDRLLAADYVSCDETRFQVLNEKNRKAEDKSWMWIRSTPADQHKIILFNYDISRSGKAAESLLEGFQGFLQTDGYGGYDKVGSQEGIEQIGCSMHARRYFEKANKMGAKSGRTLAERGLIFFKTLYEIEDEIRDRTYAERFAIRLEKSKPLWEQMKVLIDQEISKVPQESLLGKALTYFTNQYDLLIGYMKDGKLEIDSGYVERAIRKFAIGRNNWLFADSEAGAESSALLYSVIITMKVNQVNPFKTLKFIFEKLPHCNSIEDYENLADYIIGVKTLE